MILSFIARNAINNPDLESYEAIISGSDLRNFVVEPMIIIISIIIKRIVNIVPIDLYFTIYFIFIFSIISCIFYANNLIFNNNHKKSLLCLLAWLLMYGVIHSLIQIRYGMASSICMLSFAASINAKKNKFSKLVLLAPITHFSSIFAASTIFLLKNKIKVIRKKTIIFIHISFIAVLLSFKFSLIFNFLPAFLNARIITYINNESTEFVSVYTSLIAFILYLLLFFRRTNNLNAEDLLRLFGILGFLPYIIIPEVEILIRTGIPFQYLLISYLAMTYKKKKYLLTSTLPLLIFMCFKISSNLKALLNYLN